LTLFAPAKVEGMDASAFEYFHTVARTGSISRAAGELGMEPSTLTRHIGRLERDVGVKLFHRSGRGMVLTDAGTLLLQEASKVVDTLQHTRRVAADLAAEGPSQIVIAAQPTIAQVCFGAMARALRDRFPHARIRVTEGFGHELVGWLQEGKVDVALLYVPGQSQIADYELLLQEPLHCILPPGRAAPQARLDTSLVLDLPLVLPSTPQGLRALAESWAQRHGKRLTVAMECDGSTFMTRRLVQAGLGCSILPMAAVHEDVSRGLLQAVRLEGMDALRAVALATAQNRPAVTDLWQITRLLREVVAELVATGQWPGVDRMAG
jgi:DNA-binding transcriptional LysR family regulator